MIKQFAQPLLVSSSTGGESISLERLALSPKGKGDYDEVWLQQLLFARPELLPVDNISSKHNALVPLCREMETGAGPVDLVYINEFGMLTLVECKLWRNPEARRTVVGQILEYAAHVAGWTYDDLREAVRVARRADGDPICDLVAAHAGTLDAHAFIDDVQTCLEEGRFLLLVVGDGIRQNVLNIAELLRRQAGLSFTFGLVEMAIYRVPTATGGGILVQPRILGHSVEIVRELARQPNVGGSLPVQQTTEKVSRIRLSELEVRERLRAVDSELPDMVFNFLESCRLEGLQITSRRSLMIHHVGESGKRVNFGTFYFNGDINTNYIVSDAEQMGDRGVGESYLERVAQLLPGASVSRAGNTWTWRVVVNGRLPRAKALLQRGEGWLAAIVAARDALSELEARQEYVPS